MNLAVLMDELAEAGKAVVRRTFAWPTDKVEPIALVIAWPELVTYDLTYGRGQDKFDLPMFVIVGRGGVQRAKRDQIADLMSGSMKQAIESVTYADGVVVQVKTAEIDFIEIAGIEYLAVKYMVDINGAGYGQEDS